MAGATRICCQRESISARSVYTNNHAPCHFMQSHIRKVYACLAVTCHLRFWQNDRGLLRATAVTRGWNGYRNSSSSSLFVCLFVCCFRVELILSKDSQSGNRGVLICNLMQWKKLLRGLAPAETGSRNLPVPLRQQYALRSLRLLKNNNKTKNKTKTTTTKITSIRQKEKS